MPDPTTLQIHDAKAILNRYVAGFASAPSGTHEGAFLGVPATGRWITVKGMVIDRLVAGKMADSRILMDTLGMMRQLGALPGPATN